MRWPGGGRGIFCNSLQLSGAALAAAAARQNGISAYRRKDGMAGSGNGGAFGVARLAPFAGLHDGAEPLDRVPGIAVTVVQGGEAEAQDVRRAEVADHAVRGQRAAD